MEYILNNIFLFSTAVLVFIMVILFISKKISKDEKIIFTIVAMFFYFTAIGYELIYNQKYGDAFTNFVATMIGSGVGFFGIFWTISDQNKQRDEDDKKHEKERREDLAIQYKPIIHLNGQLDSIENMYYRDLVFGKSYSYRNDEIPKYIQFNEKEENTIKIYFSLKNIGRGCVNDSKMIKYSIKDPDIFDNYLSDWNTNASLGDLVPNQEMAIVLNFPGLLRLKNEYLDKKEIETTVNFICEYSDEFNVHLYELNIYFKLNIEIQKTDFDSGVENVSIIAPIYCVTQAMPVLTKIK